MPRAGDDFTQVAHRIELQIQDDHGKVAVPQQQIRCGESFGHFLAAHPQQPVQGGGFNRAHIEAAHPIHERQELPVRCHRS